MALSQAERTRRYKATTKGKATYRRATAKWAKAHRQHINAYRAEQRNRQRAMMAAIKLRYGCVDCGYRANAVALDFDHTGGKEFSISKACGKVSDAVLLAEIAKCEVRCANCHRIKTESRRVE